MPYALELWKYYFTTHSSRLDKKIPQSNLIQKAEIEINFHMSKVLC